MEGLFRYLLKGFMLNRSAFVRSHALDDFLSYFLIIDLNLALSNKKNKYIFLS